MLARVVDACRQARFVDPVVAVLGHEAERVEAVLTETTNLADLAIRINERWQVGLSTSLHTAISALPEDTPGALIVPGDMPFMTPELIDRVAEMALRTARICFPVVDDRKGHPTAIPRGYFPRLLQVEGDVGAREIVREHWAETGRLPLSAEEAHTQVDVDTEGHGRRIDPSSVAPSQIRLDNEPR